MLTATLSFLILYKYPALFLIVFAVAIIVPLPINVLLLATGAFSSFGYFDLILSAVIIIVASVTGDLVDYFLARYYGPKIFQKLKFKKNYYFERLERELIDNAPFTIFITRFVGALNPVVSLFSGAIKIPFRVFILYDFLGNLFSTIIVLIIGYFAGNYWQNFSGVINISSVILAFTVILFVTAKVFLKKR